MENFKRNVYLNTVDLEEAHEVITNHILNHCIQLKTCEIAVEDGLHRITKDAVFSRLSSPYYNAAAMDGIAVVAKRTAQADLKNPIELKKDTDFIYVNTGDPIDSPYDSVIMIEDIIDTYEDTVIINKACTQFQHIRPIGEDIVANDLILTPNHKIRPIDVSAMIAGGVNTIKVYDQPIVSVIPTGDEIINDPKNMKKGKIIDSNSHYIKNSVKELGGLPALYKPVKDDYNAIKETLLDAVNNSHIVIVGAGSSSGSKDYTASIIRELGDVYIHGVAVKPGKPVIIGMINRVPIIGMPGYPVSTYIAFEKIVKVIINGLYHQFNQENSTVEAVLSKKIYSSLKNKEYVRVKLGYVNKRLIATPLSRGAGVTMSLVKADGLLPIAKNLEGYNANEKVRVELLNNLQEIKQSIVSIGSHDLVLDYLSNLLQNKESKVKLSSAHVGSFSGVMAIKRGECHIAPIHILNTENGHYNRHILNEYFKDGEVVLLKGIKREQGLMVRKDNTKNIASIEDLKNSDISFINRQKGSGTRILLDYLLSQHHIERNLINGYEFEVTTHMMVASSVYSGTVDCGLGVKSAANVFDLDFIPIGYEDYDFLILKSELNKEIIKEFIHVLKSDEFKHIVKKLGGYKIEQVGEIIEINKGNS